MSSPQCGLFLKVQLQQAALSAGVASTNRQQHSATRIPFVLDLTIDKNKMPAAIADVDWHENGKFICQLLCETYKDKRLTQYQ